MITAVVAIVVFGAQAKPTPGALVSKMFALYYGAKTLTGKLTLTQKAVHQSEHAETSGVTDVQFERPAKLFVRQSIKGQDTKGLARIVSDGARFLYSLPKDDSISSTDVPSNRELVEDVVQFNVAKGKTMPLSVGEIYLIGRSGLYLKPEPLAVAIGWPGDLKKLKEQLASVEDLGEQKINGQTARVIAGSWREYSDAPISGEYLMAITADGNLLRFMRKESLAGPPNTPPVEITTTWDVDLKIDAKPTANIFKDPALAKRA